MPYRKGGFKQQNSWRIFFRPNNPVTFHTLDAALAAYPDSQEQDWLRADSLTEYQRFNYLLGFVASGEISQLYFQPPFILVPSTKIPKNACFPAYTQAKIGYTADISYFWNGLFIVEDVKAVFSDTEKNRAKKRVGKPILEEDDKLRHKLLIVKLMAQYGANFRFKLVGNPIAELSEDGL